METDEKSTKKKIWLSSFVKNVDNVFTGGIASLGSVLFGILSLNLKNSLDNLEGAITYFSSRSKELSSQLDSFGLQISQLFNEYESKLYRLNKFWYENKLGVYGGKPFVASNNGLDIVAEISAGVPPLTPLETEVNAIRQSLQNLCWEDSILHKEYTNTVEMEKMLLTNKSQVANQLNVSLIGTATFALIGAYLLYRHRDDIANVLRPYVRSVTRKLDRFHNEHVRIPEAVSKFGNYSNVLYS